MSQDDAIARGDAVVKGFEQNHPRLVDVAQVLRTSKLTRWQAAASYVGIGKCAVVDWSAALVASGRGYTPTRRPGH